MQLDFLQKGREKSRAAGLDILQGLSVNVEELLDRLAVRIIKVKVEWEEVANFFLIDRSKIFHLWLFLSLTFKHTFEIHYLADKRP